jgi:hypothetical protein
MTHLLLHKTPNLVSSEPGAAQISALSIASSSNPTPQIYAIQTTFL